MKNAVIYVRCCCTSGAEEAIERQLTLCKEFANKNGIGIMKEYKDIGEPGTKIERPAYSQMVTDMNSGEWKTIIVSRLDRSARSTHILFKEIKRFHENGIEIMSSSANKTEIKFIKAIEKANII